MEQLNRIELRGNVGGVRMTSTSTGAMCAHVSLVTNYLRSGSKEVNVEVTWHNVTIWQREGMPDITKIEKGNRMHVIGRMVQQHYIDAGGNDRSSYEVYATSAEMLSENLTIQTA